MQRFAGENETVGRKALSSGAFWGFIVAAAIMVRVMHVELGGWSGYDYPRRRR